MALFSMKIGQEIVWDKSPGGKLVDRNPGTRTDHSELNETKTQSSLDAKLGE